ncbi:MAG: sulfite exporter TauE/SafE family protein [Clostridiales bacterium]|nr:sulfite exporter TauE/SafE family protein [Clostridiales bacterium]
MINLVYAVIIFCSTLLGALVGIGSGVIIKPVLDLIGYDTVAVVNFISSCSVFFMSITSSAKHIISKTKIDAKFLLTLSAGSVVGGMLGTLLFNKLSALVDNSLLKSIQGIVLGTLLIVALICMNAKSKRSFQVKGIAGTAAVGLFIGVIASFLGIGGGPINVAFLVLFFSINIKDAAVYSVGMIFFSQLTKLITMAVTGSIPDVNWLTLVIAIACAGIGGVIGARLNKKCSDKFLSKVFTVAISFVAAINFYNAITGFLA